MHRVLRRLHLWIGLTAGTLLVLIGLTGSSIVFYRFLEERIYADTMLVAPHTAESRIGIDEALEAATAIYPEETVLGVLAPRHERATYLAYRYYQPAGSEEFTFTFLPVDPHTGTVLGEQVWGETVMTFLYSLHYTLTFGTVGSLVVGFCGIFIFVTLLIGLYLWWPRTGSWRQALTFKKGARSYRRNFDIHRLFGFYPLVILLALTFSGTYMIFPQEFRTAIGRLSPLFPDLEHESHLTPPKDAAPLPYNEALSIARGHFPDANISRFDRPHDPSHPYVVTFFAEGQPMVTGGYNQAFIHPYTGEVLGLKRWEEASAGDAFLAWQFPLHNGEVFGLIGRWLVFASGFLPLILYVTGLRMWLRQRRNRRELERQRQAALAGTEMAPA